jgi:hypothetical protein
MKPFSFLVLVVPFHQLSPLRNSTILGFFVPTPNPASIFKELNPYLMLCLEFLFQWLLVIETNELSIQTSKSSRSGRKATSFLSNMSMLILFSNGLLFLD